MDVAQTISGIAELTRSQLVDWCRRQGESAYRADQIRRWLFQKRIDNFAAMHDLPLSLRSALAERFTVAASRVVRHQQARDRTEKLLLELADESHVECVLMREAGRRTICISTQVGCGMGCVFCASGLLGLRRNLSTGEILEQVLHLQRVLQPRERFTNVVVMGIGEPLANLNGLLPALDTLCEPAGLGLGARRITISTVGLPGKMRELASVDRPYKLAVSLHAPNDELRSELVPINAKTGLRAILEAADFYFQRTGRRVTYEYVLLGKVNDAPRHAQELAALLESRSGHVNLIPFNPVQDLHFVNPTADALHSFVRILSDAGIETTVRKRKGADIDAACGQLRLERERKKSRPGTEIGSEPGLPVLPNR